MFAGKGCYSSGSVSKKHVGFKFFYYIGEGRVARRPCGCSGQWIQKHAGFSA